MAPAPYSVTVQRHPGSSEREVAEEPDWGERHQHHVGYRNRQDRRPGLTHGGGAYDPNASTNPFIDECTDEEEEFKERAKEKAEALRERVQKGELINFRDVMNNEEVRFNQL